MYIIKKSVFYCDHCRKYKLTSFAMKLHEKHCTMNPDRVCRMPGCRNKSCPICEFAEARQQGGGSLARYSENGKVLKDEIAKWWRRFDADDYQ